MFTFLIIIAIVLIIGYSLGKKQPDPLPRKPVRPYEPKKVIPDRKPTAASLQLATAHFGVEWQRYLADKGGDIKISNQRIREAIAFSYEKMNTRDLERLLKSFIQANVIVKTGAIGVDFNVDAKNFAAIHDGVYQLIRNGQFKEDKIIALLKKLAAEYKTAAKVTSPTVSNAVFERAVTQPLVSAESMTNQQPEESSIIDVPQVLFKIEQETSAPANIDHSELPATVYKNDGYFYPVTQSTQEAQYLYDPELYKLGTRYKTKLNLNKQEISWLNKFTEFGNTFTSIDGCAIAIIKLYLLSLKKIVKRFSADPFTLANRMEDIKQAAYDDLKRQYPHWDNYEYSDTKQRTESDMYLCLYKKCEAQVRESWAHKRKITSDFHSHSVEAVKLFRENLEPAMDEVIKSLVTTITDPDEETEIQLNAATTTRWKVKFDALTAAYDQSGHDELVSELYKLARLNDKNPSVENIYYEASKFMSAFDRTESLRFYMHYIYQDLRSVKIDNKALNKTVQKKLFSNKEQFDSFEAAVNRLVQSRDLEQALKDVDGVYKSKRKAIVLDNEAIKRVEEQHSGTVEILNEYLRDEEETTLVINQINADITPDNFTTITSPVQPQIGTSTVLLQAREIACIELFNSYELTLPIGELEKFAKENGLFKNQLIDGINDRCFEILDDILIEEDAENYTINPDYYQRIFLS